MKLPGFGRVKQSKCMVILKGFPLIVHCLGWQYNDPGNVSSTTLTSSGFVFNIPTKKNYKNRWMKAICLFSVPFRMYSTPPEKEGTQSSKPLPIGTRWAPLAHRYFHGVLHG